MEMSVYSHKANDRFRRDKISILEQLGIYISKEKEAEMVLCQDLVQVKMRFSSS